MKSQIAARFSLDLMKQEFIFLWTFTFKECLPLKVARAAWRTALNGNGKSRKGVRSGLVGETGFCGLRFFELHPRGHGLHVHVVTESFFHVNKLRPVWQRFGGGRIHVKAIPRAKSGYVAKYLGKDRPEAFKGWRMWSAFGGQDHHRVSDIVFDSGYTRAWRALADMVPGWKQLSYFYKKVCTALYEIGDLRRLSFILQGKSGLGGSNFFEWEDREEGRGVFEFLCSIDKWERIGYPQPV